MKRFAVYLLFSLLLSGSVFGQNVITGHLPGYGEVSYVEGELLITWEDHTVKDQQKFPEEMGGLTVVREFSRFGVSHIKLSDITVEEALKTVNEISGVKFAEPNFVITLPETTPHKVEREHWQVLSTGFPDDEYFYQQWALENTGQAPHNGTPGADISIKGAWEITTGSSDVIIAVLDSGVDYNHPDLQGNLWQDDDGNYGRNFSPGASDENDPMDGIGHGTHIAGIIGAVGNNGIGVAGINWDVTILPVKVFNDNGSSTNESLIRGFEFVLDQGVRISNHSYGTYNANISHNGRTMQEVVNRAASEDHLIIAAAGNSDRDTDEHPIYPANYVGDNIISVMSSDFDDTKPEFSNYGPNSVDIAAPGDRIISTGRNGAYVNDSGSSMSTAMVSGVAGLLLAEFPDMTALDIKDRLLLRADHVESLSPFVREGRRLNAYSVFLEDDGIPPTAVDDLAVQKNGQRFAELQWTAVGSSGNTGKAAWYDLRISESQITAANFDDADEVNQTIFPQDAGELQTISFRNLNPTTTYYVAVKAGDIFGNVSEISNVAQFQTNGLPDIEVSPDFIFTSADAGGVTSSTLTILNEGNDVLNLQLNHSGDSEEWYTYGDNFDETGGSFTWTDISASGQKLHISERFNGNAKLELPFEFSFYGSSQTEAHISVNGFLSFESITAFSGGSTNRSLPAVQGPFNLIAPFWGNLSQRAESWEQGQNGIFYEYDQEKERLIIQWNKLSLFHPNQNANKFYTFQVILYKNGVIRFLYDNIDDIPIDNTVGLQNDSGTAALLLQYNESFATDGRAVTIIPNTAMWLQADTNKSVISPGESIQVELLMNTSVLEPGQKETFVHILSNDDNNPLVSIPVQLDVDGESAGLQLVHRVNDPDLKQIDVSVNGFALMKNLRFGEATSMLQLPADVDLNLTFRSRATQEVAKDTTIHLTADTKTIFYTHNVLTGNTDSDAVSILTIDDVPKVTQGLRLSTLNAVDQSYALVISDAYDTNSVATQMTEELKFGETSSYVAFEKQNYTVTLLADPHAFEYVMELRDKPVGSLLMVVTDAINSFGNPEIILIDEHGEVSQLRDPESLDIPVRRLPDTIALRQNYPNPFNPVTKIPFQLSVYADVQLQVFDITGRRVTTLVNDRYPPGRYEVEFDGRQLASGVYIYRLIAGGQIFTRKFMLVK